VSEGLVAVSAAKVNVQDVLSSGNPRSDAAGYGLGYTAPTASNNLTGVTIDAATGLITMTTTAAAGNGTLTIMPYLGAALPGTALPVGTAAFQPPADSVKYRCAAAGVTTLAVGQAAGTLPARFAPAECK
jgi:type IV pilus assembly protein PilA